MTHQPIIIPGGESRVERFARLTVTPTIPTTRLAEHVVIDREHGTFTIDGEPIADKITPDIGEITKVDSDGPTALFRIPITFVGTSVAANVRGVLVVGDTLIPWTISEAGPSIVFRNRVFLVSVELLAECVDDIHAPELEVGADGR